MRQSLLVRFLILTAVSLSSGGSTLRAQVATKLIDHGPDGEKLTFVVLGDGYSSSEQSKYAQDVQQLVVNGVFGHDFYKDNISAFNVYRVDLISKDSGVSTLTKGRDTALQVVYSGEWDRCWLEESAATDQLIIDATVNVKKADFVLIVANESGYGGCQRGGRLYVTAGDPWDVVAHEYGHGIAGLYDEYVVGGIYTTPPINIKNCSTILDVKGVSWRKLIKSTTPVPTDGLSTADPNQTVGMFTGCDYAVKGIYRPAKDCRMNSTKQNFCPVCLGLMKAAVMPYLSAAPPSGNAVGATRLPGRATTYMNMVIRISKDKQPHILRATQLSGQITTTSNFVPSHFFAFTKGNQPIYAQYLADDPFTVRGFVDPRRPERGEKISQSNSATVVVNVPDTDMSSATKDLGFQFYKVSPTAMGAFAQSGGSGLDVLLTKLKANKGLTIESDLPALKLAEAVKSVQ